MFLIIFRIFKNQFEKLVKEIVELFPSLATDSELLFESKSLDIDKKECAYTRGTLYNFYKVVRKDLRDAKILEKCKVKTSPTEKSNAIGKIRLFLNSIILNMNSRILFLSDLDVDNSNDRLNCLTDADRHSYSIATVSSVWEETYEKRVQTLVRKVKKVRAFPLKSYLSSFPCLQQPLGTVLVRCQLTCTNETWIVYID